MAGGRTMLVPDKGGLGKVYANFSAVEYTREEVSILFGVEQVGQPGQEDVRVQLATRIVLSPLAAKRLAAQLDGSLREYEVNFGPFVPSPTALPAEIQRKASFPRSKDLSASGKRD